MSGYEAAIQAGMEALDLGAMDHAFGKHYSRHLVTKVIGAAIASGELVPATWQGLQRILADRYPDDIFTGESGDPGPQLLAALREVERLRDFKAAYDESARAYEVLRQDAIKREEGLLAEVDRLKQEHEELADWNEDLHDKLESLRAENERLTTVPTPEPHVRMSRDEFYRREAELKRLRAANELLEDANERLATDVWMTDPDPETGKGGVLWRDEAERLRDAIRQHRQDVPGFDPPAWMDYKLWAVLDEEQQ